jgi:hypothetical protein
MDREESLLLSSFSFFVMLVIPLPSCPILQEEFSQLMQLTTAMFLWTAVCIRCTDVLNTL